MATTGFWPVKGSLNDVIKYAENPDKTMSEKYFDKDLYSTLTYAANTDKTDKQLFISGINCSSKRAYSQMTATKKRFGKTSGNVAYHGYQSFKSDEVTPEEAHQIGVETAERMWGDNYEILVTTHLNTDNLHNHFVVNSVSFKTGRKFENHISDHIKLREISDEVCLKYEKSVLKDSKFYGSSRKEYWIHKNGSPTHRDILRQDVDMVIRKSANLLEFKQNLENIGYVFNRSIMSEHPSVTLRGWKKPIRINSLGKNYTTAAISRRTAENKYRVSSFGKNQRTQKPKHTPLMEMEYQLRRVKYMDTLEAMFYLLLELLKPMRTKPQNYQPPLSPTLRQEVIKFEQYQKQFRLLHDNEIHTVPELDLFIDNLESQISELKQERSKADNHRRRAKTDDEKELYKAECRGISAKIKPLKDKLQLAESIKDNISKVQEVLDLERKLENKIINRERNKQR